MFTTTPSSSSFATLSSPQINSQVIGSRNLILAISIAIIIFIVLPLVLTHLCTSKYNAIICMQQLKEKQKLQCREITNNVFQISRMEKSLHCIKVSCWWVVLSGLLLGEGKSEVNFAAITPSLPSVITFECRFQQMQSMTEKGGRRFQRSAANHILKKKWSKLSHILNLWHPSSLRED